MARTKIPTENCQKCSGETVSIESVTIDQGNSKIYVHDGEYHIKPLRGFHGAVNPMVIISFKCFECSSTYSKIYSPRKGKIHFSYSSIDAGDEAAIDE